MVTPVELRSEISNAPGSFLAKFFLDPYHDMGRTFFCLRRQRGAFFMGKFYCFLESLGKKVDE